MTKTKEEIVNELMPIFRDILDDDGVVLTLESTPDDVEGWDSLAHIRLVLAIGKHFGIRFPTEEVVAWVNVGSIVLSIQKHLS